MNKISEIYISIILPIFNESRNIREIYKQLKNVLEERAVENYEIIFIDDGSSDESWNIIKEMQQSDPVIKGIKFTRNFGHQHAIKAGIDLSKGDAVVMMDADLQHPPKIISELLDKWEQGFHIVHTIREEADDTGLAKTILSKLYYKFLKRISNIDIPKGAADFRLLDKLVVNEVKKINDNQLFLRGLVHWLGFKQTYVNYKAVSRFSGSAGYSFKKSLRLGINGVMSYSIRPLRFALGLGCLLSLLSFLFICGALYYKFTYDNVLDGWTSLLISVLGLGGIQLLSIGLLGEYIGQIYLSTRNRPEYVIDEII